MSLDTTALTAARSPFAHTADQLKAEITTALQQPDTAIPAAQKAQLRAMGNSLVPWFVHLAGRIRYQTTNPVLIAAAAFLSQNGDERLRFRAMLDEIDGIVAQVQKGNGGS